LLDQYEYRTSGMSTVVFQCPDKTSGKASGKTSGKTSEEIWRLIKERPEITIPQLAESLSGAIRSVELHPILQYPKLLIS